MNRKVLILAHDFPPAVTGVFRPLKFAKYLPEIGWNPIVLTLKENQYFLKDEKLLSQLPESAVIYRTKTLISEKQTIGFRDKHGSTQSAQISRSNLSFSARIKVWLRDYILLPDTKVLWIPFALLKARQIFPRFPDIKVIIATGPPFTTFLLGYLLKLIFNRKLILDFRDPWTQWFSAYRQWENRFRKKVEYWLEKVIVSNADGVISTTPASDQYLQGRYANGNDSNKFTVIYNGFDSEDYAGIKPQKFKKFTIVYTGKIVTDLYSPESFFKGVHGLLQKHSELGSEIQVIFLGTFPDSCLSMIDLYQLQTVVKVEGLRSHRECLEYQTGADLLLLLLNDGITNELTISGKLFEYFYTRNPIFAVIPRRSAAGYLIEESKAGIIIEPDDIDGIERSLYDCYLRYRRKQKVLNTTANNIQQYERKNLTRQLADFMENTIEKK